MTCPRKSLVCLADTPYYHVVARCVRRAWLWGPARISQRAVWRNREVRKWYGHSVSASNDTVQLRPTYRGAGGSEARLA
jgi:hypothetical protein